MLRLITYLWILLISFAPFQEGYAKSPPPGAGAGNVPANILLMLDTSGSMSNLLPSGDTYYPIDWTFDSQGNIFVAEYYDIVKKYNNLGEFQSYWGGYASPPADGKFDLISAIAIDSSDKLYVADRNNARIQKFDNNGNFVLKMSLNGTRIYGVAVDTSGNVFGINNQYEIQKFSSSGTLISTWAITSGARHLTIASNGHMYVANYSNKKIENYTSGGQLSSSFNLSFRPYGIDMDQNGDLYISDWQGDKIYKYTTSGTQLGVWGQWGSDPGEWKNPAGVHVNSSNVVFVADYRNHRLQDINGNLLTQPSAPITRLDAAKNVIKAIVSDSNLTSGADFGLMEWNTTASMLVNVSPTGASQIYTTVDTLTAGGYTILDDAMDLASSYFLGPNSPMDPNAPCQQNILIVISDGYWTDNTASSTAESLYLNYGIKTFTVGFATTGNSNYVTLSQKGGTYPDSPLYANNQEELLDVLSNYIQQVISSQLTFSAPTIIPSVATDESILQSTFTYKDVHQWKGRLLKYDLLPDGNIGPLLWDAGAIMNNVGADNRNIWTVATALPTGLNNFTAANLERLRAPLEEYGGTTYTDQQLTDLIEFVRGKDSYVEFPTGYDDENEQLMSGERWKMADIYHSKASVVGPPSAYVSDETNVNTESYYRHINNYNTFKQSSACGGVCASRNEIIYVGSNSGMLHAFDSTTGQELWAFIPPSMLPNLKGVISTQSAESQSIYGVDGSPTIKDIYYNGQWRTVLIAGLRQGGHSYFALDVTDPNNPAHLFSFDSRPIYNVVSYWDSNSIRTDYDTTITVPSEYDFQNLGEAWSQPVIAKLKINSVDKWVAVLGGGFNNGINPNYGAKLYVLDIEDGGKILQAIDLPDSISGNGIESSVPPKLTVVTADSTTLFQNAGALAYVTDLEGKLWEVNLSDQGIMYDKTQIFDSESTFTNGRLSYHELAATITTDSELMMYFGTGDIQQLGSVSTTMQNRAYGLRETNFPVYTSVTAFNASSLQDTTSPANCPSPAQKGWYKDMTADEKVAAKAAISNQTVFISRYKPDSNQLCSAGFATLSEVNFMCGDTVRDSNLGTGVPTEAVIYNNKIYIGVSDDSQTNLPPGFTKSGNLIVGTPANPNIGEVRLESWREDF